MRARAHSTRAPSVHAKEDGKPDVRDHFEVVVQLRHDGRGQGAAVRAVHGILRQQHDVVALHDDNGRRRQRRRRLGVNGQLGYCRRENAAGERAAPTRHPPHAQTAC